MATPTIDGGTGTYFAYNTGGVTNFTLIYTTLKTDDILVVQSGAANPTASHGNVSTITDSTGITWHKFSSATLDSVPYVFHPGTTEDGGLANDVWWAHQPSIVASGTATIEYSVTQNAMGGFLVPVNGCSNLSSPFDSTATNNVVSTSLPGTITFSTSNANDLLMLFNNNSAGSTNSGYVANGQVGDSDLSTHPDLLIECQVKGVSSIQAGGTVHIGNVTDPGDASSPYGIFTFLALAGASTVVMPGVPIVQPFVMG